ncbi:MAG: sigma-70 family RNA polymerase sigma factor [Lentisphaeria bacterium]|nr:sigma-70 family RNA polymerase sigma factor [Lentisphaeria bacterium]
MKTGRTNMSAYPSTHKTMLEKIQAGDEVSWQEFYDRYSPVVLQLAAAYRIPAGECRDVLQNVMLKFFQHDLVMKYDPQKARFRTYFNQVVCSCIIDYLRQKKQYEPEINQESPPEIPVPAAADQIFAEEWRKQMLQEALDRLRAQVKPATFLAFHLTVFQGKSARETADFLKIDIDAVYVAKSRCTAKLKEIIAELNHDDSELGLKWDPRK